MRYLTNSEIKTNLNLGKTVEQWLQPEFNKVDEVDILTWLEIEKEKSSDFVLRICKVYDEGDGDSLDFYGFTSVDPDELYEEKFFMSLNDVYDYISKELNAFPDRFLNQGMCQDEYSNYLKNKNR